MSTLQQEFHKAVYNKINIFIADVRRFAAQKELQNAYISVPESNKKGRKFEQVVLDDVLNVYASIMHDVDDEELPISFYQQILGAREGAPVSEAGAKARLQKALTEKRTIPSYSDYDGPEFLQLLEEFAPNLNSQKLVEEWLNVAVNIGTVVLSNSSLSSTTKAQHVTKQVRDEYQHKVQGNVVPEPIAKSKTAKTNLPAVLQRPAANQSLSSELTTLLKKFTKEVTPNDLPPKHGREDDVHNLSGVLLRKDAPYIALHGEEGVGKSTVIDALAKQLNEGNGPGHLKNGKIYRVSLEELIFKGGRDASSTAGDLVKLTAEHNRAHPNNPVILYIDDFGMDSDALSQGLRSIRAQLSFTMKDTPGALIIAEMTDRQMFVMEKEDKESLKKFQKIPVEELSIEATTEQLKIEAKKLARHHKLQISDDSIDHIIRKTTRYMPTQCHPAKDLNVLQAAAAQAELNGDADISDAIIDTCVAKTAKLPLALVGGEASERIDNLEANMNTEIFGQEDTIKAIADTIGLVNQGLQDPKKPLGVFYLTGPTGVGKTAIVKALGKMMFADEDSIIRINLGEFQEKHTVSRITGSPPGYVGYGDKTALEDVTEKPFSIVLIDEAEKGHPDVDNVLMNIMDEGELTLLNGKKLNFRNCIIVFTSNLGATAAEAALEKRGIGFNPGNNETDAQQISEQAAKERLKPEFRNRATFLALKKLTAPIVEKITMKEVNNVSKRLRDNKAYAGMKIELSDLALKQLMSVGFNEKMGARPMQRALQTYLNVPLGKWLKENKESLLNSHFTLVVNSLENGLDLSVRYPVAPEQNNNKPATPKVA